MSQAGTETGADLDAPFEVANGLLEDPAALRSQMERDGCLFFQRLVPSDSIVAARREILACCADAGWLLSGSDPEDAIAAAGVAWTEPQPEFMAVYNCLQRG